MIKKDDKVRLNSHGMEIIGGLRSIEEVTASTNMTVIDVDYTLIDDSPNTGVLRVDGLIGKYMLTTDCVDLIETKSECIEDYIHSKESYGD